MKAEKKNHFLVYFCGIAVFSLLLVSYYMTYHKQVVEGITVVSNVGNVSEKVEEPEISIDDNDLYGNAKSLYEFRFPKIAEDKAKKEAVKEAFLHAYKGYSKYCWGSDELLSVSGRCSNQLNAGLTIVDSLSTLWVMGLKEEFEKARKFIKDDFKPNGSWSVFEFVIRFLGGFLSAYQLSGDKLFLDKAIEAGEVVYHLTDKNSGFFPSGIRLSTVDGKLKGYGSGGASCLAEVGTFQLEFMTLSAVTGDPKYIDVAMRVYDTIWKRNPNAAIISSHYSSGASFGGDNTHLGAGTDSYYEYIIKAYVLSNGISPVMLSRHKLMMREIKETMLFRSIHKNLTGLGIRRGNYVDPMMEHLATFVGGMIAVGAVKGNEKYLEDLQLADSLVTTYHESYVQFPSGVAPDRVRFNVDNKNNPEDMSVEDSVYLLRPESVESNYVMWKFTGLNKYREFAWDMFKGMNNSCRTEYGFSTLRDVNRPKSFNDKQESFFLAETLKYLYLSFEDSSVISPEEWVFNTEAHPLRIWNKKTAEKFRKYLEFRGVKTH